MSQYNDRPAVGYVRVNERNDALVARLRLRIGDYCKHQHLKLTTIFCDQGYDGSELARPGVAAITERLKEADGLTVLVPDLDHLSPFDSIRSALKRVVEHNHGHLVVISPDQPNMQPGQIEDIVDPAIERSPEP